jgi:hypothetical protein
MQYKISKQWGNLIVHWQYSKNEGYKEKKMQNT